MGSTMRFILKVVFLAIVATAGFVFWPEISGVINPRIPANAVNFVGPLLVVLFGLLAAVLLRRRKALLNKAEQAEVLYKAQLAAAEAEVAKGRNDISSIVAAVNGLAGSFSGLNTEAALIADRVLDGARRMEQTLVAAERAFSPEKVLDALSAMADKLPGVDQEKVAQFKEVLAFMEQLSFVKVAQTGLLSWDNAAFERFDRAIDLVKRTLADRDIPSPEQITEVVEKVVRPVATAAGRQVEYLSLDDRKQAVEAAMRICNDAQGNDWDEFLDKVMVYINDELKYDRWNDTTMKWPERNSLREDIRGYMENHFSVEDDDGSWEKADEIMHFLVMPHAPKLQAA